MMNYILLPLILIAILEILAPMNVQAQSQSTRRYTNLSEALAEPEKVYILIPDSTTTSIPADAGKLINLRELNLINCDIRTIADEFFQLQHIEGIFIEGDTALDMREFLRKAAKFEHLSTLYLGELQLHELPKEIGLLTKLVELQLYDRTLRTLPPSIGALQLLQKLDISGTMIESIPDEFSRLAQLKDINLEDCQLHILPQAILLAPNITSIALSLNPNLDIRDLFLKVGKHPNIKMLALQRCNITALPKEVELLLMLRKK